METDEWKEEICSLQCITYVQCLVSQTPSQAVPDLCPICGGQISSSTVYNRIQHFIDKPSKLCNNTIGTGHVVSSLAPTNRSPALAEP